MNYSTPEAEIEINQALVRSLIDDQFDQYKHLDITFLDEGWDNVNFKLGTAYIIRLPRRVVALPLIQNEIVWLPRLKEVLPIAIPTPLHVGQPSKNYPWPWTIIPWYNGVNACQTAPVPEEAIKLAGFLKTLHAQRPEGLPLNKHRSGPLEKRSEKVIERINRLSERSLFNKDQILSLWNQAIQKPTQIRGPIIHGDLHPRNVIVRSGRIEAIIDWGDITAGDISTDLSAFWMLFERTACLDGLNYYGANQDQVDKSIGWAIYFSTLFLELDTSNEDYKKAGIRTMANLKQVTL